MRKALALVLMLVMAVIAGCGGADKPAASNAGSSSDKKALQEITLGTMPDTDSIPFIIAEEKGYFAEEGLKVNIQYFKSAMDRDSALQSGNIEGGISDMLAVAMFKSGGFDVRVTSFTDGNYRMIAGKDEAATKASELKGKDVSVSKNTIIEYVTDQIMAKEGLTGDDINKVIIPQIPTRLEMLQNGKLAAATLPEPMGSIAIYNGCRLITDSETLKINPGVMVFTNKCVESKKAELQAMYRAYNKAVRYINSTDQNEYMDLVIKKVGFPAVAKEALKLPKYHEAALPKESDVLDVIKWLNEKNIIKDKFTYKDIVVDILNK